MRYGPISRFWILQNFIIIIFNQKKTKQKNTSDWKWSVCIQNKHCYLVNKNSSVPFHTLFDTCTNTKFECFYFTIWSNMFNIVLFYSNCEIFWYTEVPCALWLHMNRFSTLSRLKLFPWCSWHYASVLINSKSREF